jgi:hypothetical protein
MVNNFIEEEPGLEDIGDLLRKGAQIGRDPFAPQVAKYLGEAELEALRDENRRPFRHPQKFWLTISLLCCGAMLQLVFPHQNAHQTDDRTEGGARLVPRGVLGEQT